MANAIRPREQQTRKERQAVKDFARRQIIVLLGSLLCWFSPSLQAATSASQPASGTKTPSIPNRGALYKISSARHTLYLFGTIHVGSPDFYPLEPRITGILKQAPVLALELDPQNVGNLRQAVQRHGLYPNGQRFQDHLPEAQSQRVTAALTRYQLPVDQLQHFRPWMLATTLTLQEYAAKGYRTDLAADIYLANAARAQNKPVLELESAESQMAIFERLTDAQQAQFLSDTLDEMNDADTLRKLKELVDAWRTADSKTLEAALAEMENDKSFVNRFTRKALLDERNPTLADSIANLLKQYNGAVAAIGVLHLVGPQSVPQWLQRKGYKVEKLY